MNHFIEPLILVTGGAGFIGSNLVAALEEKGARVVVSDWLGTDDKWRNLRKRNLEDFIAPEALPDFLKAQVGKIEMIFHLGAISATTETDGDAIIRNNFRLSKDLWEWCAWHGVRFVYASSAATYGDGELGFDDALTPEKLAQLRPLNLYGWSKHWFDRWVTAQSETSRQPPQCVGLKFFNVYGPNEYHKAGMRSVVHQIYPVAARNEAFALFKSHRPDYQDGGQLRDFVWVGDVVDVMLWLQQTPTVSGLFNLGSGKARSFRDLGEAVYKALGRTPLLTFRDMPENLRAQYQYFTEAKLAKLQQTGYDISRMTSLEKGVTRYVQDFLMQQDPYR
jgi:ADP-L-glycero-D-manno-heptose 6-epimerase